MNEYGLQVRIILLTPCAVGLQRDIVAKIYRDGEIKTLIISRTHTRACARTTQQNFDHSTTLFS